jgi:multiple sugar transport system substrate-binding protein
MSAPRPFARITRRQALGGLAGAALSAAGCGRKSREGAVTFWAFGQEGRVAAQLLNEFHKLHPDIQVNMQALPWTAAHEKLLTAYAGETLPDLCQLGSTWVPEFMALDVLQPLDDFIAASADVQIADYFEGALSLNRFDNALYGVPWYVDTRLMFYRHDLLKQAGFSAPPQTWAEWTQMLAAVKSLVGPDRYSVLLPLNEFEPLEVLALQQPIELLRDNGRWGNFRSPEFRRTLSFYREMFVRGWAPRKTNTEISNVWDEFGNGYFSFYISGAWNIGQFKKRLPPHLQDCWRTAPMPGPDGPGMSRAGGGSLVIFRTSRAAPQAWKLAEFLSRQQTQERFYELTGDVPPRRSTWESATLRQATGAQAFRVQMDRMRAPPKVPEWYRIQEEMRIVSERVVQNRMSVDAAVEELDRKADRMLEKRRWLMDRGKQT